MSQHQHYKSLVVWYEGYPEIADSPWYTNRLARFRWGGRLMSWWAARYRHSWRSHWKLHYILESSAWSLKQWIRTMIEQTTSRASGFCRRPDDRAVVKMNPLRFFKGSAQTFRSEAFQYPWPLSIEIAGLQILLHWRSKNKWSPYVPASCRKTIWNTRLKLAGDIRGSVSNEDLGECARQAESEKDLLRKSHKHTTLLPAFVAF